ncbi:MAG: tRNA methyltransferase, has a role in tRNA modification [Claussenomyces sp. TS43310]|nr:MAG: tRNA methyltransferase, has a role in tRNA modification [Claussenomyces sp. TS43310]
MAAKAEDPEQYEEEHVHAVYEQIASHFSATRHKPWPIVDDFLRSQPAGSVGVDVGCGNGKYLRVNPDVFIVGSDRSANLVGIAARHQPHAAVVADNLSLPHDRAGRFDFAISIAVVHHLSTPERRRAAIAGVLDCLRRPAGRALLYVWALEQSTSRRGWDAGHEQDVMVPWVMKAARRRDEDCDEAAPAAAAETTFQRYYHLYRAGELERDIVAAGGEVLRSGYEKDNWWAIASRPTTTAAAATTRD